MRVYSVAMLACGLALAPSAEAQDFYQLVNHVGQWVDKHQGLHCLAAEGDGVSVRPCSDSDNQKWIYRQERLRPKGREDRCLDMNPAFPGFHRNVSLYQCRTQDENNQKWYQQDSFVKTRDWDVCLNWQYSEGGKVNGRGCDGAWPSMKWDMRRLLPPPLPPAVTKPAVEPPASVWVPAKPESKGCTVVFVHGLRSSSGMWYRKIKDGPLDGEDTSLQRVAKLGFPTVAVDFSDRENLSFNRQADELKKWVDGALDRDKTRYAVLIGHSMGGVAALRYAQKYEKEGKVAGVITMDSPLLGSPSANLLEAVSLTGKGLQASGAVGCMFGEPMTCIGSSATGLMLDTVAHQAGPVDSKAAQYLKPGSPEITELGRALSRLEGTGIHVHSIVVGSDEKMTLGGLVSGDGVVPAYHQSVLNLKDKYSPNARISGQLTQSRQHQFDWFYSLTYRLEGRPGMAGRVLPDGNHLPHIFHNDAPHSPEVKDNVDNTLYSSPFCDKCGVKCVRRIQMVGADGAPDNRAARVVFDLATGAGNIEARSFSYEVAVSGLTGQADARDLGRFRLHVACLPGGKTCGNVVPEKAWLDARTGVTRLLFRLPDALQDPQVERVRVGVLMQTPYKTREGKDVVVPSATLERALRRIPRLAVPDSAAQGDLLEIKLAGFPDNGEIPLDLGIIERASGGRRPPQYLGDIAYDPGRRPAPDPVKWLFRIGHAAVGVGGRGTFRLKVPPGLPDNAYVISAESQGQRLFERIRIGGNRKAPDVKALMVAEGGQDPRWYRLGESVHIRGENWISFGQFGAVLVAADTAKLEATKGGRSADLKLVRDTCKGDGTNSSRPEGCEPARGEVDQYWSIGSGVSPGRYRLRLTDGINDAMTQEFEIAASAPLMEKPARQPDGQGASTSVGKTCDPKLPRVWQPGCVEGPQPRPGPQPTPAPKPELGPGAKVCDPEMPRIWQPGCVDAPQTGRPLAPASNPPEAKPAPAPVAPAPPPPTAPTSQAPVCDPNRPRYAQPGCVEPADAPSKAGAGVAGPQKCKPNVPSYSQPGCIP
ncbi:MAG: alpha/beta fold hydrolase [Betaproteobacteria bacterium]|nr:alpha/beta fold hydrolase [Betaproteobacteria bacterium]